jgi:hypothetical protein
VAADGVPEGAAVGLVGVAIDLGNYIADLEGFTADLGAFVAGLGGVTADFGGTAVCESRASLLRDAEAPGDGGLNGRGSDLALLALRSTCEHNITHLGKG